MTEAPFELTAAETAPSDTPAWYRSLGAFAFWLVLHFVPLVPKNPVEVAAGQGLDPILPPLVAVLYDLALAAGFIWWFALRRDREAGYRRETFNLRPIPAGTGPRLAAVAVLLVSAVMLSLVIVPRFIAIPSDKTNALAGYLKLPLGVIAVLSMVSLVAPLLEEFVFRGWLQSKLLRWLSPPMAIVATALAFSFVHFQAFGFASRMIFALTAGYLAWSTRSIWPGVILHALYNGVLVAGGEATPGVDDAALTRWAHTPAVFFPALAAFVVCSALLVAAIRLVPTSEERTA